MISKFTKNSKIHQALDCLYRLPMGPSELKRAINFSDSTSRFDASIIVPLINEKFVVRKDMKYFITPLGQDKLMDLGQIKQRIPNSSKIVGSGTYDGAELRKSVERPGADDHLKYPSRMNDRLHYRDGRVEYV
jgi:hypothetical protein